MGTILRMNATKPTSTHFNSAGELKTWLLGAEAWELSTPRSSGGKTTRSLACDHLGGWALGT